MIGTVAAREYTTLMRDGRMKLTVAIVLLMLFVALVSAVQRYRDISEERATSQALVNAQFGRAGREEPPRGGSLRHLCLQARDAAVLLRHRRVQLSGRFRVAGGPQAKSRRRPSCR